MSVYQRLAHEVIEQLGGYRAEVEDGLAESHGMFIAALRVYSPRYRELVDWGLDLDGRKCLDETIKMELKRIRRWE